MKQVVLNVGSIQLNMSSSNSNINKHLRIAKLFTWMVKKFNKFFVPLFSNGSTISTFAPWTNSRLSIFFLHITIKSLGMLRKKLKFVFFSWKVPILSQLKGNCDFPVSEGPTNDIKSWYIKLPFFIEINLFVVLLRVKGTRCTTQKSHPNSIFVTNFSKTNSPKATKDNQQNHKKFGQEYN